MDVSTDALRLKTASETARHKQRTERLSRVFFSVAENLLEPLLANPGFDFVPGRDAGLLVFRPLRIEERTELPLVQILYAVARAEDAQGFKSEMGS
jgi:hypothetical protein